MELDIEKYIKVAKKWEEKFSLARFMLRSEIIKNKILQKENEQLLKSLKKHNSNTILKKIKILILALSVSFMLNGLGLIIFLQYYL